MALKPVKTQVVVQKIEGKPGPMGPRGPEGPPGFAPSLEQVVAQLRNDKEFMAEVARKTAWNFQIVRDEMGRIQNIQAIPMFYEEEL